MDFDESPEEIAFREQVRAWLARPDVLPAVADISRGSPDDELDWIRRAKVWQAFLVEQGWAGITWPVEFGGRGGTPQQDAIFFEECLRVGVWGNAFAVGILMAGPTIITHGNAEQKQRHLPPMLRGDQVWCQLFSEPGAGSDLAGLSTRAERDGDEWVVNGQKVWTSGAHYADRGILLTRTDLDAPKHRGITYLLVDMHQPGVEVRPLRQITGGVSFNEVFLTDVRVPVADTLGEINGGWGVAMTTLANERGFMGSHGRSLAAPELIELAREHGLADDPVVRQRLARAHTRGQLARWLSLRLRTASTQGRTPGPEMLVGKLAAAWNLKQNAELALEIEGAHGMLGGAWQQSFLGAPGIRIAGGSDEVQRNVIGERGLGLPGEPRVDKDVPFRTLLRPGDART